MNLKLAAREMLCLLIAFCLLLTFAGCGSNGEQPMGNTGQQSDQPAETSQEVIKISYGHGFMPDTPHHQSALKFKEMVEERTGGKVIVEIFPAGQLGSAREMFEGIQLGTQEMALLPTARISGFAPELQLLDLPFLFPDRETAYKIFDGEIGNLLLATLERSGVKGAAIYEDGFKHFTSNKPIATLADFRGQKFRTMESPLIMEQFKALGTNPTPLDFGELYNALQQGVVDGQENPLVSIASMKFYEVQKYLLLSEHAYLGHVLMFGKNWFDGLPQDVQQVLMDTGRELAVWQRQAVEEEEQLYLQTIRDSGTEIVTLSEEEKEKMKEVTRPVHKVVEDIVGKDLLEKTYAEVERLSK
jgi:tripartite ATP-independent transporter DctP family solute receptor